MALDSPKKPFSKRDGYRSQSKEISVWEDAPESLRHFVLGTAVEMGYGPYPLREAICSVLHVRPDPSNWSEYPNVWGEAEGHVYGCEWFKLYDFVEKVYDGISKPWSNDRYNVAADRAKRFQNGGCPAFS